MSSKLYKESFYSLFLGMATGSIWMIYNRNKYLRDVNQVYWGLKLRFQKHPHLSSEPDSDDVIKNFGPSNWNDPNTESAEDLELHYINVYEGTEEDLKNELKERIKEAL